MTRCDGCGFDFAVASRDDVGPRVVAATKSISRLLVAAPDLSMQRPAADRWSATEYGAHVRDVLITIRDRLVIGIVEDNPAFKPLYRDERVDLGLYAADRPLAIVAELDAAVAMFTRLFGAIEDDWLSRPVMYGSPDPHRRTVLWMGLQAAHESEHHLGDIAENMRALDESS